MPDFWYIARDGKQYGPISQAEFVEFLKRGHLSPIDYVWHDGLDDWLLGIELLVLLSRSHRVSERPPVAAGEQVRPQRVSVGQALIGQARFVFCKMMRWRSRGATTPNSRAPSRYLDGPV